MPVVSFISIAPNVNKNLLKLFGKKDEIFLILIGNM